MSLWSWWRTEPLAAGTAAPGFTLADDQGRMMGLADFRGRWVVLVFYPGDDTPTCTAQLCALRDRWGELQGRGVVVMGINPAQAEKHGEFRRKFELPFPLLVDPGQRVAAAYQCNGWVVRRTVYAIDPGGVIRMGERGKPGVERILAGMRGGEL